jgi:regulator of protease activity HflC (stomatin/prohibitin superfamily)
VINVSTIAVLIVVLYVLSSIKILREYERGVIFRLGRVLPKAKGPGLILVFAPIDRMVRISLRIDTLEVPPQDVVTRDNVTVKVNAVIFFRVIDARLAVLEVSNFLYATSQLAQTTLRSVLGEVELDELLGQREKLNVRLQSILDQHLSAWGVKVVTVEVKQVDLAEQMIRAIARQAEAERERRAKIIHAEGEYTAAEKLGMAARGPAAAAGGDSVALPADPGRDRHGEEHHHCVPTAAGHRLFHVARFGKGGREWRVGRCLSRTRGLLYRGGALNLR